MSKQSKTKIPENVSAVVNTVTGEREVMSRETVGTKVMRHMAWERVKGELRSIAHTYYDNDEKFIELRNLVDAFISEVEETGCTE